MRPWASRPAKSNRQFEEEHHVNRIRWGIALAGIFSLLIGLTGSAAAAGPVSLRLFNIQSPTTSIDLYVDGTLVLANVPRNTLSKAVDLSTGVHQFDIKVAGSSQALNVWGETMTAGGWTLVSFAGGGSTGMELLPDENETVAGSALLRVWSLSGVTASVTHLRLAEGSTTLTQGFSFPFPSQYVKLSPGSHTLTLHDYLHHTVLFTFKVDLESDTNYTFFMWDVSGSPRTKLVVDASTVSNTALASQRSSGSLPVGLIMLGILALALAAATATRRRPLG
jgi:hypothetical protein